MRINEQLWLVLRKNWTLRRRQPVILALQLLWPVVIFLVVVVVRHAIPPTARDDCYYKARAQPSAGMVSFAQSYLCTINNTCENRSSFEEIPSYPHASISRILPVLMPLFDDDDIRKLVSKLPFSLKLMSSLSEAVLQPKVTQILGASVRVKDLFRDPEKVKLLICTDLKWLSPSSVCDLLLRAQLNFPKIVTSLPKHEAPRFECSPRLLQDVLVFDSSYDAESVADQLCRLSAASVSSALPAILAQVDLNNIARKVNQLLVGLDNPEMGRAASNVLNMVQSILNRHDFVLFKDGGNSLGNIRKALAVVPSAIRLLKALRKADVDFAFLEELPRDLRTVVGDQAVIDHLEVIFEFMRRAVQWMTTSEGQSNALKFGSLWANPTAVKDYLILKTGSSSSDVSSLFEAELNPLTTSAANNNNYNESAEREENGGNDGVVYLCSKLMGLRNTLTFSDDDGGGGGGSSKDNLLRKIKEGLCESASTANDDQQEEEELRRIFRRASAKQTSHDQLNTLLNSTERVMSSVQFVATTLGLTNKTSPHLDVVWKLATTTLNVLLTTNWTRPYDEINYNRIVDLILSDLPQPLHRASHRLLIAAHLLLAIADNATNIAIRADSILSGAVREHSSSAAQDVLSLGPDVVFDLLTFFTNETRMKSLLASPDSPHAALCKLASRWPDGLLSDEVANITSATILTDVLCQPRVASFVDDLLSRMGVRVAARQIKDTISQSGSTVASSANSTDYFRYDLTSANFTSLVSKTKTFLRRVSSRRPPSSSSTENEWKQVLKEEFRGSRWDNLWKEFDAKKTPALLSLYVELLHKQLRHSPIYDRVTDAISVLNSVLEPIISHSAELADRLPANSTVYWPFAVETFIRTLQDKPKFDRLIRTQNWTSVVCSRSKFWEVLVVPMRVNANELQQYLCTLFSTTFNRSNASDAFDSSFFWPSQKLRRDFANLTTRLQQQHVAGGDRPPPTDDRVWTDLSRHVVRLHSLVGDFVRESARRNYDLSGLLRMAADNVERLAPKRKAQLGFVVLMEGLELLNSSDENNVFMRNVKKLAYVMQTLIGVTNDKLQKLIATQHVRVTDLTSPSSSSSSDNDAMPLVTSLLRNALSLLPETIEVSSNTIFVQLDQFLERVLRVKDWSSIPCRGRSIAELFPSSLSPNGTRNLQEIEASLCSLTKRKQIRDELASHPVWKRLKPTFGFEEEWNHPVLSSFRWSWLSASLLDLESNLHQIASLRTPWTLFEDAGDFTPSRFWHAVEEANHARNSEHAAGMLLRAVDVVFSYLVRPRDQHLNVKRTGLRVHAVVPSLLATVDLLLNETAALLTRVVGGERSVAALLGFNVDTVIPSFGRRLGDYVSVGVASALNLNFWTQVNRIRLQHHPNMCANVTLLSEAFVIPENVSLDDADISAAIGFFCRPDSNRLFGRNESVFERTLKRISFIWLESNDSSAELRDASFSRVYDRSVAVRRLLLNITESRPRPQLHLKMTEAKPDSDVDDNGSLVFQLKNIIHDQVLLRFVHGVQKKEVLVQNVEFLLTQVMTRRPSLRKPVAALNGFLRSTVRQLQTAVRQTGVNGEVDLAKLMLNQQTTPDDVGFIFTWLNDYAELWGDALLNTTLENPTKLQLFLQEDDPWASWCSSDGGGGDDAPIDQYFTVSSSHLATLKTSRTSLCKNFNVGRVLERLEKAGGCQEAINATDLPKCFGSTFGDLIDVYRETNRKGIRWTTFGGNKNFTQRFERLKAKFAQRLDQVYKSNRSSDPLFWVETVTPALELVLRKLDLSRLILADQLVLNWINTKLKLITEPRSDWRRLFSDYPYLHSFVGVLNSSLIPFVDSWLFTAYTRPAKLHSLLRRLDDWSRFCETNSSAESLLEVRVSNYSDWDQVALKETLCRTNTTLLSRDIMAFLDWRSLEEAVDVSSGSVRSSQKPTLNGTLSAIQELNTNLHRLTRLNWTTAEQSLPHWLNGTVWKQNMVDGMRKDLIDNRRLAASSIAILTQVAEANGYSPLLRFVQMWLDATNLRLGTILENSTTATSSAINVSSLFNGFPALRRLVPPLILHSPQIVETFLLLAINDSSTINRLMTSSHPVELLCNLSSNERASTNNMGFRQLVCNDANSTELKAELRDFLAISFYEKAEGILKSNSSSSPAVDATQLLSSLETLLSNIKSVFGSNNFRHELLPLVQHDTWNRVLERVRNATTGSSHPYWLNSSAVDQMVDLFLEKHPNFNFSNAIGAKLMATQNLANWLTTKIQFVTGSNRSRSFTKIDRILSLLDSKIVDLVEESGMLLLNEPQALSLVWSEDPRTLVCTTSGSSNASITSLRNFPTLRFFICEVEVKPLVHELEQLMSAGELQHIYADLTATYNETRLMWVDAGSFVRNVTALMDAVNVLASNGIELSSNTSRWPSVAEWERVWQRLETTANTTFKRGDISLWVRWLDVVPLSQLKGESWYSALVTAVSATDGVVTWMGKLTQQLLLVKNNKNIGQHLNASVTLLSRYAVDLVETLSKTAVESPNKLSTLIRTVTRSGPSSFCGTNPSQVVSVPASVAPRIDDIFSLLCRINVTNLVNEAETLVSWSSLSSAVTLCRTNNSTFNSSALVHLVQETESIFNRLSKAEFDIGGRDLLRVDPEWRNGSLWSEMAKRLQKETTPANTSTLASSSVRLVLHSVISHSLKNQQRVKEAVDLQILVKLSAKVGRLLVASGPTSAFEWLKSMHRHHRNAGHLVDLLQRLRDVVSIVFATALDPVKLYNIVGKTSSPSGWRNRVCLSWPPEMYFVIPSFAQNSSLEVLLNFVCLTNFDKLVQEMDAFDDTGLTDDASEFHEDDFLAAVDELVQVAIDVVTNVYENGTTNSSNDWERMKHEWDEFYEMVSYTDNTTASAEMTSFKLFLVLLGPTLELVPGSRPVYHWLSQLLQNMNSQLDDSIEELQRQADATNSSVSKLNIPPGVQLALWLVGCEMNDNFSFDQNCTSDLHLQQFWQKDEFRFRPDCNILNATKLAHQVDAHLRNTTLQHTPVQWSAVGRNIQTFEHKLNRLLGWSRKRTQFWNRFSCVNLDIKKSVERWIFLVLTTVPNNPTIVDLKEAVGAVMAIVDDVTEIFQPDDGPQLYTLLKNRTTFEGYLTQELSIPEVAAHRIPSSVHISKSSVGQRLLLNSDSVCGQPDLWKQAVISNQQNDNEFLEKVFCSKQLSKFLDSEKVLKLGREEGERKTITKRQPLIDIIFTILPRLERFPHWNSVVGMFQAANLQMSRALNSISQLSNASVNIFEILSNSTLLNQLIVSLNRTSFDMSGLQLDPSLSITQYFSENPSDLAEVCTESLIRQFAVSLVESQLGAEGDANAVFTVLCKKPPAEWSTALVTDAHIPKSKLQDVLHSVMTVLPPDSAWNQDLKWRNPVAFNWPMLRDNAIRILALFSHSPNTFVPARWHSWDPVLTNLFAALPEITRFAGGAICKSSWIPAAWIKDGIAEISTIVYWQMQKMPNLQDVACELPDLNLATLYKQLTRQGGLLKTFQTIYNLTETGFRFHSCAKATEMTALAVEETNQFVTRFIRPDEQRRRMKTCFARWGQTPAFVELDRYWQLLLDSLNLLQQFAEIGQTEGVENEEGKLRESQGLSKMIEGTKEILTVIQSEVSVYLPLQYLLRSDSNLLETMTTDLEFDPIVADVLMKSEINLNRLVQLNFSIAELSKTFCSDHLLSKLIRLPIKSRLEYQSVVTSTCRLNGTAMAIIILSAIDKDKIVAMLPNLQARKLFNWENLSKVGGDSDTIIRQMETIWQMSTKFDTARKNNATKITLLEMVIGVIQKKHLEKLVDGINLLTKLLWPVIGQSQMEEDLHSLQLGIQSLQDFFSGKLFPLQYKINKLFNNYDVVDSTLTEKFEFDSIQSEALGETTVNVSRFLTNSSAFTTFNDFVCDIHQLDSLFDFPDVRLTSTSLSTLLCKRNVTNLVMLFIEGFSFQEVMKQLVLGGLRNLEAKANLSSEDTEQLVRLLPKMQTFMPNVTRHLQQLHSMENFNDLIEQLASSEEPVMSNTSLVDYIPGLLRTTGKLFCGKPLRNFLDDFKIVSDINFDTSTEQDENELKILPHGFCRNLYHQIVRMKAGPVIWSYVKPLLQGKVLFAPENPMTKRIIKQANRTMERLAEMSLQLQQWAAGSDTLRTFGDVQLNQLKQALNLPLVKAFVEELMATRVDIVIDDLSSMVTEVHRFHRFLALIRVLAEAVQCFNLNRFVGLPSEKDLEQAAQFLYKDNLFMGGIVFLSDGHSRPARSLQHQESYFPNEVSYKIRMDIDNVPSTKRLKQWFWRPGSEDNFADDLRYFRGFVQMQDMIDEAIIQVQTGDTLTNLPSTYTQQFPYPCYSDDEFGFFLKGLLPLITTLAWIFLIAIFVRERVLERELTLEQVMRMMGLRNGVHWVAWFLSCFLVMIIVVACMVLILKFGGILPHSNPILLYLFLLDFAFAIIMFCYLMSVFFKTATVAALTSVIIYLITYLPFIVILTLETHLILWQKLLVSVVMSTAFGYGCLYLARYEEQGTGLQWDSAWTSPVADDEMNLAFVCLMLLFDGILYYLVALIVSAFTNWRESWYSKAKLGVSSGISRKGSSVTKQDFAFCEEITYGGSCISSRVDPRKVAASISLHGLHKVFDANNAKKVAVNKLTLDFYENQITTLLGQNGAGKTTLIHLLTGMFPPSSGSASIYGKDVQSQAEDIRHSLGVCPQKNVLFPLFTVREHLEFYSKLKGASSTQRMCEDINKMLETMNLSHKQDELVCNLSEGMRRRLCVAIAFVGGSRTIILDEPTSGVDPVARRHIWDLIVSHKNGRTILLTTHHMDEADILSDRVAIIHQGKLLCCGSPLFLKSQFGTGYHVTVTKKIFESDNDDSDSGAGSFNSTASISKTCNTSVLLSAFRKMVPNIQILEDHGVEVVFTLPYYSDQGLANNFEVFFAELERNQVDLGIGSYGLSCPTLEEVFLTVCAEADAGLPISSRNPKTWLLAGESQPMLANNIMYPAIRRNSRISVKDMQSKSSMWRKKEKHSLGCEYYHSGCSLKLRQMSALLQKRLHYTLRDWAGFTTAIVLPCLFVAIAMGFSLLRSVGHPPDRPLLLTPAIYGHHTYSFFSNNAKAKDSHQLIDSLLHYNTQERVCIKGNSSSCQFPLSHWASERCTCRRDEADCSIYDDSSFHYFEVNNGSDVIFNMTTMDTPLWLLNSEHEFRENRYGGWSIGVKTEASSKSKKQRELENIVVWYNNKGYHSLPSYLNSMHNAYLQSRMADDQSTYKIRTYNHPIMLSGEQLSKETLLQHVADVGIALVLLAAFSFIPASFVVYIVKERVREEKRLQYVSGVGPLLYWSASFVWDVLLSAVATGLAAAIIAAIGLPLYMARLNLPAVLLLIFCYCWATTPLMYILEKLFIEASLANMVLFCGNIFIGINTMVCVLLLGIFQVQSTYAVLRWVFLIFPQYAFGGALVELARNYIQAEIFAKFDRDTYSSPFGFDVIGMHLVVLAVQGVIFFIVNLLIECRWDFCARRSRVMSFHEGEDTDVQLERRRVHEEPNHDLVQMVGLTKVFSGMMGPSTAVNDVCLGIPRGECFGLLGVNGAGKTTTFAMLTNQLKPSSGKVLMKGKSISRTIRSGSRVVGFCPQCNALDDLLTGEETLTIYGQFRGIPSPALTQVVKKVLEKFHLQPFAKKRTKYYSLGMKRKLCAAISVLGDPEIVLMDEPTSGMDPTSRRHIWANILHIVKDKRSVVLTSHSMEECDNLCNRLAIMVNGELQCLGSPQYLKHKFGEGYTVTLRIRSDVTDWGPIVTFIHSHFASASLKARHCNTLEFLVPSKNITLSAIFSHLERQRHVLGIEDFSVTQTTLDQVFVNFVRKQSDGVDDDDDNNSPKMTSSMKRLRKETNPDKREEASGRRGVLFGHELETPTVDRVRFASVGGTRRLSPPPPPPPFPSNDELHFDTTKF